MVRKAFFFVPVSAPVRICSTFLLVCMLIAWFGVTEPRGLPLTAPELNEILPKLATGSCLFVLVLTSESSMIASSSDAAPLPDFVRVKV